MSSWKLIRLNFGSTLTHFGETGIGLEVTSERVRSDTLFSAWMSAYIRLFGKNDLEALLARFEPSRDASLSTPPFCLSSTFIYHQYQVANKGKTAQTVLIDYVPRPLAVPKGYPITNDLAIRKTYRQLDFLPLKIWQRWYQSDTGMTPTDLQELSDEALGQSTGPLRKAGTFSYRQTFHTQQLPKVSIDRTTRATNFYHTGFTRYLAKPEDHSGLYFLLHFPETDTELEHRLHAALELLGEDGLGGERSSGAGQFEISEWSDLSPQQRDKSEPRQTCLKRWHNVLNFSRGNHYSLISLCWQSHLSQAELLGPKSQYSLLERGGWIVSHQLRRQMVRMFAEGSVFSAKPLGQLADVTPSQFKAHHVYRSGISFSLPIALEVT